MDPHLEASVAGTEGFLAEGQFEIRDQIVRVLDPDREPDQRLRRKAPRDAADR